jgi:hypothetical protein
MRVGWVPFPLEWSRGAAKGMSQSWPCKEKVRKRSFSAGVSGSDHPSPADSRLQGSGAVADYRLLLQSPVASATGIRSPHHPVGDVMTNEPSSKSADRSSLDEYTDRASKVSVSVLALAELIRFIVSAFFGM